MDSSQQARTIIETNIFLSLATADANGKPWSSILGYAFDDDYNLYWVSAKDAIHSANIRLRPEVSISILAKLPEGGFDGVYLDAIAKELTDSEEIKPIISLFKDQRPHAKFIANNVGDVTGDAAWRMYRAYITSAYKRAESTSNDQIVTVREPVSLLN